jgi:hypothetical protein
MNPLFSTLAANTLDAIEDQLANNDEFSDEEMFDFFLEELDLSAEQADTAIALRPQYPGRIFLNGNSPLYQDTPVYIDPAAGLTFHGPLNEIQVLDAYRLLLLCRPGKRLNLGTHTCVGLNSKGELYWTPYDPDHPKRVYEVYSFKHRDFIDGHWEGETLEQTAAAIQHPVFID